MPVEIKFCGLTRAEDASAAAALGARYTGVIFAGGPRRLDAARASRVLAGGDDRVLRAGVFGTAAPDEIGELARALRLDVVQLHGDPHASAVRAIRSRTGAAVWAVVRVGADDASLAARIRALDDVADAVVLDAYAPDRLGGTGTAFDWGALADGHRPQRARLVVAGGLTPANVAHAIETLAPDVVDVSSGVEASPGIKDHQRMRDFVAAVRGIASHA